MSGETIDASAQSLEELRASQNATAAVCLSRNEIADLDFENWANCAEGIFRNLTMTQYHNGPGVSHSDLVSLQQSALHYLQRKIEAGDQDGDALRIGKCLHAKVLEPDTVDQVYVIAPDLRRNTKEWKSWAEENGDRLWLKEKEHANIIAIDNALRRHPFAKILLDPDDGPVEQSFFWHETCREGEPVYCKCRPDKLNDAHHAIVDLKSAIDASYTGFSKAVANFDYSIQDAFYGDGVSKVENDRRRRFVFVVVEKKPPYGIGIYELGKRERDYGRTIVRRMLDRWRRAVDDRRFDGYPIEPRVIEMPRYGFYGRVS